MQSRRWIRRAAGLGMAGVLSFASAAIQAQEKRLAADEAAQPPASADEQSDQNPASNRARFGERLSRLRLPEYWLGLQTAPVEDALRAQLDLPEGQGLLVVEVVPDSPAAKAGIKQHDVLLVANDQGLKDPADLVELVRSNQDKQISFKLMRAGKHEEAAVTPEKRPAGNRIMPPRALGGDETVVRRWMDELQRGEGPVRMHILRPGMMLPPGASARQPFPDNLSVTIKKEGDKPAQIEVARRGDKTWKVTEDTLDQLPEDVRPHVAGLLGQAPLVNVRVWDPETGAALPQQFDDTVQRQMQEMQRRLEEMRLDIDRMRGGPQAPSPRPERPKD